MGGGHDETLVVSLETDDFTGFLLQTSFAFLSDPALIRVGFLFTYSLIIMAPAAVVQASPVRSTLPTNCGRSSPASPFCLLLTSTSLADLVALLTTAAGAMMNRPAQLHALLVLKSLVVYALFSNLF